MKRDDLEKLTLQELHERALEKCAPRFHKRIAGFYAGHRRFLLALLERCGGQEKNRPRSGNAEGEP